MMVVVLLQNHVDTDGAMEGLVTKHEVWTWELLHVLFSHIPGSEAPQDALPPDDQPAPMVRRCPWLLSIRHVLSGSCRCKHRA